MRILYIDIDSLRPDHLSCYGYQRRTSPNIDAIAAQGVRFDNCFVSDAPCLPSRTSLFSGRFGIHTGVMTHGGTAADMFQDGPTRGGGGNSILGQTSWMRCLRKAGLHTMAVSPFGERHAAWHWYANFTETYNTGKGGLEIAEEISPVAIDWINRRGKNDNWFLHVNFWDPHTHYRTPASYGNPFKDQPIPDWLTEEVRQQHWAGCGPHSARELGGHGFEVHGQDNPNSRQPLVIDSMAQVRRMFDGYDVGIHYADHHVGLLFEALRKQGVLDDTAIIISADHGEHIGELNVYGDHQMADYITSRVPMIVRWPGVTDNQAGRLDTAFHYQNDIAATAIELVGGQVPGIWDGKPMTQSLRDGTSAGRDYLVVSQGLWSCQRSVRFHHGGRDYICIRSYHDGYHGFPDVMLFDTISDPHEQHDLAMERPEVAAHAMALLTDWQSAMLRTTTKGQDPLWTVIQEGGPKATRGKLPKYLKLLRETGREQWAQRLAAAHPREANEGG